MKTQIFKSSSFQAAAKRTCLLVLAASLFYVSCKKGAEKEESVDGVSISEAGDNDTNMKNGGNTSAAPTGPATLAVYPVRAPHNTGYDSGTDCAPSSWNCGNTYSNSDFIAGDHYGIDIWGPLNAPIAATVTGVITFKGFDSGLGNTVVIREPSGWHHWLGHLNSIASGIPGVGSTVTAGTIIGYLGHTGSNSGGVNHLHMSINHGSGYWSTGQNFHTILKAKENDVCGPSPVPAATLANGKYKITSKLTGGRAIAVQGASTTDGAAVILWDYTATNPNDEWNVTKLSNGFYRITNVNSGDDLAIQSASYASTAAAIQWPYVSNQNNNDEWSIVSVGSGYYKIMVRHSQMALNVEGAVNANGTAIIQYPYSNVSQSQWAFTLVP